MNRPAVLALGGSLLVAATLLAERAPAVPATDAVELDAVVVDAGGRPVTGLRQEDFQIRDDGRPVSLTSFSEVAALGTGGRRDGRSMVLLLDDSGIKPEFTPVMQDIARRFLARAAASDDAAVVRFNSRTDEPIGDRRVSLMRIAEFRAGAMPFFGRETLENALTTFAKLARGLERIEHRRKVIVCIGAPRIFDIDEPAYASDSLLWPFWVKALSATAHSNVSVYVVDPEGLRGRMAIRGSGLVGKTGGETFSGTNAFERIVDLIWAETSHYYLLGYTPPDSTREIHDLDVKVTRAGAHVRARRSR